jgi:hypothetical protein
VIEAVNTAIEALKVAIEAGETQAGVKAVQDYKDSQVAAPVDAPTTDGGTTAAPGEPVEGGEAEAPATAQYGQQDLDNAVAAQKQADQALAEAMTAKMDAVVQQNEALKGDIASLKADFEKLEKDAE